MPALPQSLTTRTFGVDPPPCLSRSRCAQRQCGPGRACPSSQACPSRHRPPLGGLPAPDDAPQVSACRGPALLRSTSILSDGPVSWVPRTGKAARGHSSLHLAKAHAASPGPPGPAPGESDGEGEGGGGAGGLGVGVALLLEVEGVMVDVHRAGHLEAFNAAFLACGLESWARWSTGSYNALHRRAGGDPAVMLRLFLDSSRWPMEGMDEAAKAALVLRLLQLRDQEFQRAVKAGAVPLRPGLVELLEEALQGECHVAAIAGPARCGEATARQLLQRLPPHLQQKVLVVGKEEVEGSAYWQVAGQGGFGPGASPEDSLAAQLSQAVAARKQEVAEQVARVLKVRADLDTGTIGAVGVEGVASLRAACELLQVPLGKVVVLAGSQLMVQVAQRAGLPCVAVRSSVTAQAEFPGALQVYEDFGPGSLTLGRLLRRVGLA